MVWKCISQGFCKSIRTLGPSQCHRRWISRLLGQPLPLLYRLSGKTSSCLLQQQFQLGGQQATCQQQAERCFGQPASVTHPHLLQDGEVTPGITKVEYHNRRLKFMSQLMQSRLSTKDSYHEHIVIIPSAPRVYMTNDIPYPFRQNTDFLYLCGFQEPDSVLILSANGSTLPKYKSVIFVPKRDPSKELWEGARSGVEGAIELTGVDAAENTDQLETYLYKYMSDTNTFTTWYNYLKPVHLGFHVNIFDKFIQEKQGKMLRQIESTKPLCHKTRLTKSEVEVQLMKTSADIAADSFVEVMKFSHSGINEAHLYAKMDYECRMRDAEYLAYLPVVAGGNRANTIHYISNNQIIQEGELVLMDAGCEYHGYASDITRTWPVSGKFSREQRAIYDAVLDVQKSCIRRSTINASLDTIYMHMLKLIGVHLQHLGIMSVNLHGNNLLSAARQFCPHHVGHYLGMDVHDTDTIPRNINVPENAVITIEPGIYLPHSNTSIPKRYRGIGVRIEDDILVTAHGPVILTEKCPKDPDHIEEIMENKT